MKRFKFFLGVLVVAFTLGGCGGGGGSGGSGDDGGGDNPSENTTIKFQKDKKVAVIDNNKQNSLLARDVDEQNSSIKYIKIDSKLAKQMNNKSILFIPSSDKYPLGYMGKILDKEKLSDGNIKLKLEDAGLENLSSLKMPKTEYNPLKGMKFAGIISPFLNEGQKSGKRNKTLISENILPIKVTGESIDFQKNNKISLNLSEYIDDDSSLKEKKELILEISGAISNINISNSGKYQVDATWSWKPITLSIKDHFKFSYDGDLEFALRGSRKFTMGYFEKVWRNTEEQAFKKLGISFKATGLDADDKKGKIPIAGIVFTPETPTGIVPVNLNSGLTVAKPAGIIIWIYANLSISADMDGSIGIASHFHYERVVDIDNSNQKMLTSSTNITVQPNKRYLEAPFIDGNIEISGKMGLSIEADLFVAGIRILNARSEIKSELKQKLASQKRLSYGLDTPDSKWKWGGGVICLEGSLGMGMVSNIDFSVGVGRSGKKLDLSKEYALQYPKQEEIDKITEGRVGTWWKRQTNKGCINVVALPELITAVNNPTKSPISKEEYKNVVKKYKDYAFLSQSIYNNKREDKGKKVAAWQSKWEILDITYQEENGFKAGLYKNLSTGELVISYGGTTANSYERLIRKFNDNLKDFIADIALMTPIKTLQPQSAIDYYIDMKNRYGEISGITGHSLGGSLAQYVGLYSGVKTVTFNTAPLAPFEGIGSFYDYKVGQFDNPQFYNLVKLKEENIDGKIIESIDFINKNKIVNIMTPYDPISNISTGMMSIDDIDNDYLMATKFNLNIPPNLKLDYLITGEQIVIPIDNQGGALDFKNHSMDLILNDFKRVLAEKNDEGIDKSKGVSYTVKVTQGGKIFIENLFVKNPNTNQNQSIESWEWAIYNNKTGEYIDGGVGDGYNGGYITDLDAGEYQVLVKVELLDGTEKELYQIFSVVSDSTTKPDPDKFGDNSNNNSNQNNQQTTSTSLLKKTGQTISYTDYDDGYYQAGVTPNYTRDDSTGIVTDHVTGLMWQDDYSDNGGWIKKATFEEAKNYCENLTLGGYNDWRLPTRKELESIVDYGRYDPAIDPVFNHTSSGYCWSSTTFADNHDVAWIVYFWDGYDYRDDKDNSNFVRCVRDGE